MIKTFSPAIDARSGVMKIRLVVSGLIAYAAFCAVPATAYAQIFETNFLSGTIGEYTTSGTTVNPSLVSGLGYPVGIATFGGNLFVTNFGSAGTGTIGVYTTSGATVNASLVSGLNEPAGIATFGGLLYVTNF